MMILPTGQEKRIADCGGANTLRKGFTLLELILVMIILCTVLAAAVPSLRGFFSSRQINNVAEQILALTRYARINSISSSSYYRVYFDPDRKRYWVSMLRESEFSAPGNDFGRYFVIPSDIEMSFENISQDGNLYYIEYNPEGYSEECMLRFEDSKNNIVELNCYSPAEDFVLVRVESNYGSRI